MQHITVTAIFHPQVWVNDYAMEIDGARPFQVTLSVEEAHHLLRVGDESYEADNLWHAAPASQQSDHSGPFYVEVCDAIEDALGLGFNTLS